MQPEERIITGQEQDADVWQYSLRPRRLAEYIGQNQVKQNMEVFIKAGTILPFGPEVQYSSEKPWDELEIRVYPGADGSFTLYEDEGDNYNYEKGKFSEIQFVWNEADRTLNIAPRKGSYKGMLQHRRFHIVLVGADSGAGDQPMQASKSVEYDGKAVKVQL